MKITDLKFMVKRWDFNTSQFEDFNIFNNGGVLRSVALWVKASKTKKKTKNDNFILKEHSSPENRLMFLFGDLWGRCEYEFIVKDGQLAGGLFEDVEGEKTDIFQYYVKPNAKELLEMVDKVSLSSATNFLREDRNRWHKR